MKSWTFSPLEYFHVFFPWRKIYVWAKSSYFLMRRVKINSCQYFITEFHKEAFWFWLVVFFFNLDSELPFCTSRNLFQLTRRTFGILFHNVWWFSLQIHYLTFLNWNLENTSPVRNLCSLTSCPTQNSESNCKVPDDFLQGGRSIFRTEGLSMLQQGLEPLIMMKAPLYCLLQ